MIDREDVKNWEKLPNIEQILTSAHMGAWLYYREENMRQRFRDQAEEEIKKKYEKKINELTDDVINIPIKEQKAYQRGYESCYEELENEIKNELAEAHEQGRKEREKEIINCINKYTKMLIDAMNDKKENSILHESLAEIRADEIRIRKLIIEQIKEQNE